MNFRIQGLRHCGAAWLICAAFLLLIIPVWVQAQDTAPKGVGNKPADLKISKLPPREKRWALIVGVNNFGLQGAVNDARALRDTLIKYAGFPEDNIIMLTTEDKPEQTPTKNNIIFALDRLGQRMDKNGLFLFAFSGHGKTIKENAYIVPSDGQLTVDNYLVGELSIDSSVIKRAVERMQIRQVLMILDSCRDLVAPDGSRGNASEEMTATFGSKFSFEDANKNIDAYITLYGTREKGLSYEYFDVSSSQWRGFFSRAVEEGLSGKAANENGEVTLGKLIEYVQRIVPERAWEKKKVVQRPWKSGDGFGESELILAVTGKPKAPPPASFQTAEGAFWNAIENSSETSDFEDYLKRCEKGEFSGTYKVTAELILFRLRKKAAPDLWRKFKEAATRLVKYDQINGFEDDIAEVRIGDKQTGKHGFINKLGKEIAPVTYDSVGTFSEGLAWVGVNKKFGFVDKTGRQVVDPKYDDVGVFSDGLAWVKSGEKHGFIDKAGNEVVAVKYEDAGVFSDGLAWVKSGDKRGYIDKAGNEIVPLKYDSAGKFSEGRAWVQQLDIGIGFIDTTGSEVIPPKYDDVENFSGGIAEVRIGSKESGKRGFIDKTGKVIVPVSYDGLKIRSDDLIEVRIGDDKTGLRGLFDKTGREVMPARYNEIGYFQEGLASVTLNGRVGFIDTAGRPVIPAKYDTVTNFSGGMAFFGKKDGTVSTDGGITYKYTYKYGLIDSTGKEITSPRYEEVSGFRDGLARIKLKGKYGFIGKNGKEAVPPRYDEASSFGEGLVPVRLGDEKTGKWGYVDPNGREVIGFKYDYAWIFSGLRGQVRVGDKTFYIDKTGKEIEIGEKEYVCDCGANEGMRSVCNKDRKWGFVDDSTGKLVIPFKYDRDSQFVDGFAKEKLNGKWGYIDKTGREVIAVKYDDIWCDVFKNEGFIGVTLNGKKGFADFYGNEYFDF